MPIALSGRVRVVGEVKLLKVKMYRNGSVRLESVARRREWMFGRPPKKAMGVQN